MTKYTLAAATLIALISGIAQAEQTNFDGLTVSGSVLRQAYSDTNDDSDDNTRFDGFGVQLDYSINRIIGVTGGYTHSSSDDLNSHGLNVSAETERFYSGLNLGYRFEGEQWAIKPFGTVGINTLKGKIEATYQGTSASLDDRVTKPYLGAGVAASYKQMTATLETDASMLDDDILFVESRLTLGYRF